MEKFKLVSKFKPSGDQPAAIEQLVKNYNGGVNSQVLLGVTGSGKTYVMANVIEKLQKPTLIIEPNKILAAQTYAEFKSFFPNNAVEYFISYYDYYQPEAYIPSSDTYIEKDSSINDHIDRLRLKATTSLLERKDVIVVASVSCIYNLGSPKDYQNMCVEIIVGGEKSRDTIIKELVAVHYERNEIEFIRGKFRVKGDTVEIFPAYLETAIRVDFFGDDIESIKEFNPLTGEIIAKKTKAYIYPAKHFVTTQPKIDNALGTIKAELDERLALLNSQKKLLEAQRLEQRTKYDMEMLRETGFCSGVENYSRHLSGNPAGTRPTTLIDYFLQDNNDFLMIADESHISLPQIRGMYEGDRSRKQTLVDFGFRLPSALDNRPLKFPEFEKLIRKFMMVSATPGAYELERSKKNITDLVIRPTGLIDPEVVIRPINGQIQDLMQEIQKTVDKKERTLVTTLTKKMAEDLAGYLKEKGFKVEYLHSEIETLDRIEILKNLRLGKFDVLVGINLLREGLDLPEVSLVAVLDADKEGFLRSESTLIQICGRAARNVNGHVLFYADTMTGSMQRALQEMRRRRDRQIEYNVKNRITPKSIIKAVHDLDEFQNISRAENTAAMLREDGFDYKITPKNIDKVISEIEESMKEAADNLDFESATVLRDRMIELKSMKSSKKKIKQ
ncbi:excinuclease ABC subunit UvrB [Endomicrobium proavitum]|uniref:UvrABC system protein B n=1 Tax=Endomicrobium proavitum TaxID=1408281 RepID=A0A0G3WIH7_9BACT|nr:excinuclease ABC subunit UvrB [Endomicrobium proavitum]AKL97682.1 excinulease of nucleotide excision repair, DNA damage recognition component [Endomicrobium proavitum]